MSHYAWIITQINLSAEYFTWDNNGPLCYISIQSACYLISKLWCGFTQWICINFNRFRWENIFKSQISHQRQLMTHLSLPSPNVYLDSISSSDCHRSHHDRGVFHFYMCSVQETLDSRQLIQMPSYLQCSAFLKIFSWIPTLAVTESCILNSFNGVQ